MFLLQFLNQLEVELKVKFGEIFQYHGTLKPLPHNQSITTAPELNTISLCCTVQLISLNICALMAAGGWWFNDCYEVSLNNRMKTWDGDDISQCVMMVTR